MDVQGFLQTVVTSEQGYFELCTRRNGSWEQNFYDYPNSLGKIADAVEYYKQDNQTDVYFSSYLFSTRSSAREHALPSRTIQQDLDEADIAALPLTPTILVRTSPGRHQGFWVLSHESDQHEYLSKKLAYSISGCDHSGWPIGRKVRVPYTVNYKYEQPYPVEIIQINNKRYTPDDIQLLPDIDIFDLDDQFILEPPVSHPIGPYELVEQIKDYLSSRVYAEYMSDSPTNDRSASLYALMIQCFKSGLDRDQVYWIALHSPNNKFSTLRYNADRELAKDVLRAESDVKQKALDVREVINDIRKHTKILVNERKRAIYNVVFSAMKQDGSFIRTQDDRRYYIVKSQGRPIDIEPRNSSLSALLDIKYGINETESEHDYISRSLDAYVGTLPETGIVASLSYYDMHSKQLLIHNGRRNVYSITPEGVEITTDGEHGIIFPWNRIIEPFTPDLNSQYIDWGDILFGDIPNTINMTPYEAKVLLKVWLMFLIIRNAASTRPILAFFGQPGSQKTSIIKKIYAMIYGKHIDVSGLTSTSSFDTATSNMPFFALDNLDTWEKWIPDRLAQSAGRTDVIVRRLYTNNQVVRIKRQALVGITAHDPKFGRADVADRMLIIALQRFENLGIPWKDETRIMDEVVSKRNQLWGSLIQDLHKLIQTPMPTNTDLQLRIQDFARFGEWIALSIGETDTFRNLVNKLKTSQVTFNLDEEHGLVSALLRWLQKTGCAPGPKTQDSLYMEVISCIPGEDLRHFEHLFPSSNALVKRISTLQATLNTVMQVEFGVNKAGQRTWTFRCLDDTIN